MSAGSGPLVTFGGVTVHFAKHRRLGRTTSVVHALDGIDLTMNAGETLGVVGETGSGKSTLGRALIGLVPITGGEVFVDGAAVSREGRPGSAARALGLQMVFQDPAGSLNPRRTVGAAIDEALRNDGATRAQIRTRVAQLLDDVALPRSLATRYPDELSGGQQQRVAIARALASNPRVIVLDEPVSALDTSTQAQVLNLLLDLRERHGLTYLFISHDIGVVRFMSDRIAVMYLGKLAEVGPADTVERHGLHPYSICLESSVPHPDPRIERNRTQYPLRGTMPSPLSPPAGCRFHTRCPISASPICSEEVPALIEHAPGRWAACHFAGEFLERYDHAAKFERAMKGGS